MVQQSLYHMGLRGRESELFAQRGCAIHNMYNNGRCTYNSGCGCGWGWVGGCKHA